jgi:hypothetical protein
MDSNVNGHDVKRTEIMPINPYPSMYLTGLELDYDSTRLKGVFANLPHCRRISASFYIGALVEKVLQ